MPGKREPKKATKERAQKPKKIDPLEPLKLEIAAELGLAEKVRKFGWGGLTSAESGRLGGIMNRRLKKQAAGSEKPGSK